MTTAELRALDAEIAVKIMGWKQYLTKNGIYYLGAPDAFCPEFMLSERITEVEYCGRDLGNAPHYSTDPAASKALRDRLSQLGWNWDLGQFGYIPSLFTFDLRKEQKRITESAETEELAVALCALKAVVR